MKPSVSSIRLILTSAGSAEQAAQLARILVKERAAACVSVSPQVCSFYRWDGELQEEGETQLFIKTRADQVERVRTLIAENHSYDLPEFLVLPIVDGDPRYLAWIDENCGPDSSG